LATGGGARWLLFQALVATRFVQVSGPLIGCQLPDAPLLRQPEQFVLRDIEVAGVGEHRAGGVNNQYGLPVKDERAGKYLHTGVAELVGVAPGLQVPDSRLVRPVGRDGSLLIGWVESTGRQDILGARVNCRAEHVAHVPI
jgi:hypothetical protein